MESRCLTMLRFGGDFRLLTGQVPPWPEAVVGEKLGDALARRFGVPFYFPSPQDPDDDCPNWWQQEQTVHCADCGKQLATSVITSARIMHPRRGLSPWSKSCTTYLVGKLRLLPGGKLPSIRRCTSAWGKARCLVLPESPRRFPYSRQARLGK
jgi:hypothetical protein